MKPYAWNMFGHVKSQALHKPSPASATPPLRLPIPLPRISGAHCDHEPFPLCNDGRRDLPLPKGEGRGEGERRVRITNRFCPNDCFAER
jgi:hypothetical protein